MGREKNLQLFGASLLRCALFCILLAALAACSVLREQLPTVTPAPTAINRLTADQVALAFQGGTFFSNYGQVTLLIEGTIATIIQQNGYRLVELKTAEMMKVYCQLGGNTAVPQIGAIISVQVTDLQHNASRATSPDGSAQMAVLLKNCQII